ncbi:reverse transcriptase zinc-binding domain-containing protein, partial [Tanacetum coccineum]
RVWRIEFVITLAEPRERPPGMMTKLPLFITSLFGILIIMLLDIEDQAAWHTAENHDEGSRAHAASAVLNFSENCTHDFLTPYLDGIVGKRLVLLQANHMLRAKAMECISLVGMAVGKDKFRYDAKQIHAYKLKDRSFWDVPLVANVSWGWRKLLQICNRVGNHFRYRLVKGDKASAWFDIWNEHCPLMNHLTYRRVTNASFSLQDKVVNVMSNGAWLWLVAWYNLFPILNLVNVPILDDV